MMNRSSKSTISTSNLNFLNSRIDKLDHESNYLLISFCCCHHYYKFPIPEFKQKNFVNSIKLICKSKLQTPKFVTFHKTNSQKVNVYWIIVESQYLVSSINSAIMEFNHNIRFNMKLFYSHTQMKNFCNSLISLNW